MWTFDELLRVLLEILNKANPNLKHCAHLYGWLTHVGIKNAMNINVLQEAQPSRLAQTDYINVTTD